MLLFCLFCLECFKKGQEIKVYSSPLFSTSFCHRRDVCGERVRSGSWLVRSPWVNGWLTRNSGNSSHHLSRNLLQVSQRPPEGAAGQIWYQTDFLFGLFMRMNRFYMFLHWLVNLVTALMSIMVSLLFSITTYFVALKWCTFLKCDLLFCLFFSSCSFVCLCFWYFLISSCNHGNVFLTTSTLRRSFNLLFFKQMKWSHLELKCYYSMSNIK